MRCLLFDFEWVISLFGFMFVLGFRDLRRLDFLCDSLVLWLVCRVLYFMLRVLLLILYSDLLGCFAVAF